MTAYLSSLRALDFRAAESLCVGMDDTDNGTLGERFAALTGVLEDAATLAIEGQRQGLSTSGVASIAAEIDQQLGRSRQILSEINIILDGAK